MFPIFFRTLVYFTDQNKKWPKITKTSITQKLLLVVLWNLVQTSGPLNYVILLSFILIRQTVCILQTKNEIQTLVCKIAIFQSNFFKLRILKVIDVIQLWSKFGKISITTWRVMDRSVNYNFTPFSRVIFTKTCNITSHEGTNLAKRILLHHTCYTFMESSTFEESNYNVSNVFFGQWCILQTRIKNV